MLQKLLFLFLFVPSLLSCHNSKPITGQFSPADEYEFVILYRLTPSGKVFTKNTAVDDKGRFNLDLDSTSNSGMYRLVYKLPEEDHYFDLIYDGTENVDFNFSESSGVNFKDGQNKILVQYLKEMDRLEEKIASLLTVGDPDKKEIEELFTQQRSIQNKAEKESENTSAHMFIKAYRFYIPDHFKNRNIYYGKKKSTFFDTFDFSDEQLQSSSFPLKKIQGYYKNFVTLQGGGFYRSIIDDINFEIRNTDPKFQKHLLSDFWQSLVDDNRKNAANYLAENYLGDLSSSLNDAVLSQKLSIYKNLSTGAKAPDFSWQDGNKNEKTLYTTEGSEYYILAFWSSECSHCMDQMPVLNEKIKNISNEKIRVIAIGLEMDEKHWKETIPNLSRFIHVLKMGQDRANTTLKYDITGTPTFYVLDTDKKIIAKPRGEKILFGIIDKLEVYKK